MEALIKASEAQKRSEVFEKDYSANKSSRIKNAIDVALRTIDLRVKSSIRKGIKSLSYIGNIESREELTLILKEHGYTVISHEIGGGRVKFIINC